MKVTFSEHFKLDLIYNGFQISSGFVCTCICVSVCKQCELYKVQYKYRQRCTCTFSWILCCFLILVNGLLIPRTVLFCNFIICINKVHKFLKSKVCWNAMLLLILQKRDKQASKKQTNSIAPFQPIFNSIKMMNL